MWLNRPEIINSLEELARVDIQERLWLAKSGDVSSLDEAISQLFDDSGLAEALAKGEVFGQTVDMLLEEIRREYKQVDQSVIVEQVLVDPSMRKIRHLALKILEHLKMLN